MKTLHLMIGLGLAAAAMAQQQKTGAEKAAPAPKAAEAKNAGRPASGEVTEKGYIPKPPSLPAGAVEVEPGLWRAIEGGKVWLYRRTPFGLAKVEESGERASSSDASDGLTFVEKGDSYEFSRRTPFGLNKWTRKKTELDDVERAAVERAARPATAAKPAAQASKSAAAKAAQE